MSEEKVAQPTPQQVQSSLEINTSGSEKAYLSAAHTLAIAFQDSVDNMRNMNSISATTIGVALAKCLADPGHSGHYMATIAQARAMAKDARENFDQIGTSATELLDTLQSVASK
ncbi:hypothetical protein SCOR_34040 [Sulfidibacter corallicola]|uniref:Killing trait domain-containing protein n=1 Tax=Sulfidibacter corallicola TaxID=2818388 RepID=A0A8A4TIK2_SULCO|nr:hypothetical protein [Sulfidibacter corallicola]QTD49443.1 hypothetical protein J3U87_27980 [Sulfidibacter corallicola]